MCRIKSRLRMGTVIETFIAGFRQALGRLRQLRLDGLDCHDGRSHLDCCPFQVSWPTVLSSRIVELARLAHICHSSFAGNWH